MVESMPNLRENSKNVKLGGVQVERILVYYYSLEKWRVYF